MLPMDRHATTQAGHSSRVKEWSDATCRHIGSFDHFPLEVLDLTVQKNVITRFFNFYLGKKVRKSQNVLDLVFAVIAIIPLHVHTEITAWNEFEYVKGGTLFSLPQEDIDVAERNMNDSFLSIELSSSEDEQETGAKIDYNTYNKSKQYEENGTSESIEETNNYQESQEMDHEGLLNENFNNPFEESHVNNLESREHLNRIIDNGSNKYSEKSDKEGLSNEEKEIFILGEEAFNNTPINLKLHRERDNLSLEKLSDVPKAKLEPQKSGVTTETVENSRLRIQVGSSDKRSNQSTGKSDKLLSGAYEPFKIPEGIRMKWFGNKKKPEIEINRPIYGPVENAAFIPYCNSLLGKWGSDSTARIVLKYFFGFIALTLMRGVTKGYRHLFNAFNSTKILTHINYINKFTNYNFQYSAPHKECIGTCFRTFRKRDKKTRIMFAKIVTRFNEVENQLPEFYDIKDDDPFTMNIFRITILAHSSNYDMELVTMAQIIENTMNIGSFNKAIEATYCDETAASWGRVKRYIDTYLMPRSDGATHHWARVIDDEYFSDLCCINNYPLAVILVVFVERIAHNDGIWQSKWIQRGDIENLGKYTELGHKMFDEFVANKPHFITQPRSRLQRNIDAITNNHENH